MNRCPCDTCPKIEARTKSGDDDQRRGELVWTLKNTGGKGAPGADVHLRALALRNDMLRGPGYGKGLSNLLLPTTAKGRKRLDLDRTTYRLHQVVPRSTKDRGKMRALSVISCFLCHAVSLKEHANPSWSGKTFLTWVIDGLESNNSPVHKMALAEEEFHVFLDNPRQIRWLSAPIQI